ncbi:FAD:protein FMN transferase [Nocardioides cynanchi]|uniref:FAD:protein FMN transferase n=1 Tax=Nocardioides cynanchi TaxID=2558918 RepID=UPI001EE39033|nr:FAD:protein FMN transferase [Nocardioides cynanchi]
MEPSTLPLHRYVEQLMGMPVSLALRGRHVDDDVAHDAWGRCLESLREVDATFSTYRDDSFVSRLNRGEVGLDEAPAEVLEVLALAEQERRDSDGAFDVRRTAPDGATRFDTDGVVKGWAVQRASAAFADLADTDYCISAGGDMVCHVADDRRPPWRIGIEDPHDPSTLVATVEVRRGAVATSGHAHRGQHVVDARTGAAPTAVASVTVLADDLTWADLDATAAYALGPDALTWLRGRAGRRGLVVWDDGRSEVFGDSP